MTKIKSNPVARSLRDASLRRRVVRNRTKYTRKGKAKFRV